MTVSTNMAICLAASICASAAVYFLLRSRMSVLEDTVATLCRAVQESSSAQQRATCMTIPAAARTGAAIVNTVVAREGLIPVSDDDDSSYVTTSDEEDEDEDQAPAPTALKTVTLSSGGGAGLGGGDLSSIITSISGGGAPSADVQLAVEHLSREENAATLVESEDSDSEDSSSVAGTPANDDALSVEEDDSGSPTGESLEGYDFTQYKVPELRAFVTQYQLAPNPTKLRKGELLDLLIEAQAS